MTASARAAWTRALAPELTARANKYHARPAVVNGIRFASGAERRRYQDLAVLEAAGAIADLECHPAYPILVVELWQSPPHVVEVGTYHADFRYVDLVTDRLVVEDVKSGPTRTTAYRLRKRLVEAIHGITITEVEA